MPPDNKNENSIVQGKMESFYDRPVPTVNWDGWSRIVDAAQDPQRRAAVQEFLAGADLSADIPATLDAKVLAPRRAAGASGEQCAFILCNLGFAALAAAGSKESAEFALACSQLGGQLAPDSPDLALRRHFLSAKSILVVAALTNQPHLLWHDAAAGCAAYLRTLDDQLEALPDEAIAPQAAAAFSFSAQCLSRLQKLYAIEYYAAEVSQLIDMALNLASRLPAALASRMWSTLLPGTDASVFFRHMGAVAERSLQKDVHATDHAVKGLAYIDEILAESADRPPPELLHLQLIRAELLLLSGRHAEASRQAEALENSADRYYREQSIALKARCHLQAGQPQLAAEILAQIAPTTEKVIERWRATWMGDTSDGPWATQVVAYSPLEDRQAIWRLQAVAAADADDMPAFIEAANRSTGFLADSLLQDRQLWVEQTLPAAAGVAPMEALNEIFPQLDDATALLQIVNTPEGILTWVAQKRDGGVSLTFAPDRPNVKRLGQVHKAWSRACFDSVRHGAGPEEAELAVLFSGLMDEVRRNWGDLLHGLVDDGITQLILIGNDLVDIPLHAIPTGPGDERLIDRVLVTYVPSLGALRSGIGRTPLTEAQRKGLALCSLAFPDLDAAATGAGNIAATLETTPCELASATASFWTELATAQALHIAVDITHNARMPFDSLLGPGWLDLNVAELVAGLDLPQCEIVSNLDCETALPSMLRAPGFDLAAVFLAAGARNVLASTWVVSDDVATELAQSFFQHWVSGDTPAKAFQDALRQLRTQRPALPDFCWAGMRLVGAP